MGDMTVTITPPEAEMLNTQTEFWLVRADNLVLTTQDHFDEAADDLRSIKAKYKELDDRRKSITRPLDTAKKSVMDLFKPPLQFLSLAETSIKRKMITYSQEQEKKRRQEIARAQELARKEREKLEARAEKARAKGKEEYADTLEAQADATPVVAPPPPPKTAGISTRKTWQATVISKTALIAAVAAGVVPETILIVNEQALNQMARALKKEMNYPGVEVKEVETLAARR